MQNKKGAFVISLDFELLWGVKDLSTCEKYKENVLEAREAIPKILKLFEKYRIHATWASVGIMLEESKEEIFHHIPKKTPQYRNSLCSAYHHLDGIGENERQDLYHYGGSLLKLIKNTPNQEIGTHTYAHYYCLEDGACLDSFVCDIENAKSILKERYEVESKSLVFPRNQYTEKFVKCAAERGIQCYRGNPDFGYDSRKSRILNFLQRVLRYMDSYVPVFHNAAHEIVEAKGIVNVCASRFLRPHSGHRILERWKIKRIKREMKEAAVKGKLYHLWWHPHNFGKYTAEMLKELEEILSFYKKLEKTYGMKSYAMSEFADRVRGTENE